MTPQLEAALHFAASEGKYTYYMQLSHAEGDSLIFTDERLSFLERGYSSPNQVSLGAGYDETRVHLRAVTDPIARVLSDALQGCRVYHFHDTSGTARVRQYGYVGDDRWLKPDAANLAAVLYGIKSDSESNYRRIVSTIQQIAPFFEDFSLEPTGPGARDIILNWRHQDSDLMFGPHQLSDGTLRAICLVSLLLQPESKRPNLIVVDEPELGLHPYAVRVVASLFRSAAQHTQVLITTQSTTFLDNFEPEDIIVVDRDHDASAFHRPKPDALNQCLEDYSLGEIWEKNVMGGGPH